MRVISGIAGGLRLKSLDGLNTRPTLDRIKESLFNIISEEIDQKCVLDLFAGTGALGIETLSRGAGQATFVDSNRESVSIIKQNLEHTKLMNKAEIYSCDYETALKRIAEKNIKYDIIFLDPPYGEGLEYKAIEKILEYNLCGEGALIIVETEKDNFEFGNEQLEIYDKRNYGRTAISFLRRRI